jgi:F0F1-type ATP synthase assembly protein I
VTGSHVVATAIIASIAARCAGAHSAISVALGGLISIVAGLVFVPLAARRAESKESFAGEVLSAAVEAEAARFFLAMVLLWLVLATYQEVVVFGLQGWFVVSILFFGIALFAGDKT